MADFLQSSVDKFIFRVKKDYLYHPQDSWVRLEDGWAVIGVTDYVQKSGGDITFVNVNDPGSTIEQGSRMGDLETIKTIIPIISPVSGKIMEVNAELEDKPERVNEDPYGAGWMAKIQLTKWEDDKKNLLSADEYFRAMMEKVKEEMKKLAES